MVVFFHRASATGLVTDLVQQMAHGWYRGWHACVARLDLMTAAIPSVSRKFRVSMTNRAAARERVRRIPDWPADGLVTAHEAAIQSGEKEVLRYAVTWLMR